MKGRIILFTFGMSLGIQGILFAQSPSYTDRLNQVSNEKLDSKLGTLSNQDQKDFRQKDLMHAYTYFDKDTPQKDSAENDATLKKDYVEFRNEHKIPNYIGDDKAKEVLKKAKDDTIKTEVVKIVEAEKLLHDTFKAYHQEKTKTELESSLLKTMGNKKDTGLDKQKKEMDERIDIIGDKTASILNTSIQKLSTSQLIPEPESRGETYMASGGRVFPKLSLDEDKDFLNVRSKVMDRVQRDLMTALAGAINEFYHTEQKETSKAEIEKKEQLLAFVRVEDKTDKRDASKSERFQAIQEFISNIETHKMGGVTLSPERVQEIKQHFAMFLNTLTPDERTQFQKFNNNSPFQENLRQPASGSTSSGSDKATGPVWAPSGAFYGDQGHIRISGDATKADGPVSAPGGAYNSSGSPMSNPNELPGPVSAPSGAHDSSGNPIP